MGFPGGSDGKVSAHNVGDPGSISGLGRSPGEGNGNPLQYSCLENSTDRRAWQATVYGVTKNQTRLSDFTFFYFHKLIIILCHNLEDRWFFLDCIVLISSEKVMAPHFRTLAWKIPWMEEPGRLQSMGSLGVRHDWATLLSLFTFHFHALEKEMAAHSSVPAWRIPGTGEPGGCRLWGHTESDTTEAT